MLRAQINPKFSPTVFRFQYGTGTSYELQTPTGESIGEDNTAHSVSSEITGLTPGTVYHFRALAINFNGLTAGPEHTFVTPDRPTVANVTASGITTSSATLSAEIKPGLRATTYHFEYGRTTAYGSGTAESASIGSDDTVHAASGSISGLTPGTIYHYRVVASNEIGTTESPDQTFTTEPRPLTAEEEPSKVQEGLRQATRQVREEEASPPRHRHGWRHQGTQRYA